MNCKTTLIFIINRWLHRQEENENSIFKRVNTESLKPPTRRKLKKLRQIRFKEIKMKSIFRELLLYLIYAVIVSMLGYFARDTSAFHLTKGVNEMFTIKQRSAQPPQKARVHTYGCNETVKVDGEKYFGNCSGIVNETKLNETVFNVTEMVDDDERTLFSKVSVLL